MYYINVQKSGGYTKSIMRDKELIKSIFAFDEKEDANHAARISEADKEEFLGEIIDIFEDFLDEKDVYVLNPEINEVDSDSNAIIYGGDYDWLRDQLESLMKDWKIL